MEKRKMLKESGEFTNLIGYDTSKNIKRCPFEILSNRFGEMDEECVEVFKDGLYKDLLSYKFIREAEYNDDLISEEEIELFNRIAVEDDNFNAKKYSEIELKDLNRIFKKNEVIFIPIAKELWAREVRLRDAHVKNGLRVGDILNATAFTGTSKHSKALLKIIGNIGVFGFLVINRFIQEDEVIYQYLLVNGNVSKEEYEFAKSEWLHEHFLFGEY